MTSLPVEGLLSIESSPEQRIIIWLQPVISLERFLDKYRNYTNLKKGPCFFRHPVIYRIVKGAFILGVEIYRKKYSTNNCIVD